MDRATAADERQRIDEWEEPASATPVAAGGRERSARPPEDEVGAFLNGLLEDIRATARVLAGMARLQADAAVARELEEIAAAAAASCVTLWREIEARGGDASSATGLLYRLAQGHPGFYRQLAIVIEAQRATQSRVRDALPRMGNPRLEARLWRILETEQRSIERLHTLSQ